MTSEAHLDTFDAASRSVEEQRRATLAAIAAGGSAGRAALDQARAEVGALKGNAIRAALAEAGSRGAPQAVLDQISGQVGQGYDRQLSGMAASQGSREADLARQGSDLNSYMGQVQGAIPVLRARAQQQKEALAAKAMEEAQERAMRLQLGEMQVEKARMGLEDDDTGNPLALAKLGMAQEEHDWKREAREAERGANEVQAHRNRVTRNVLALDNKGTVFEFDKAGATGDLDTALAYIRRLKSGYLKNQKISRQVLERRAHEYFAKG